MTEFLAYLKNRRNLTNLIVLLVIVISLPIGVNLVQKQQRLLSNADVDPVSFVQRGSEDSVIVSRNGELVVIQQPVSTTITLKLVSPLSSTTTTASNQLVKFASSILNQIAKPAYAVNGPPGDCVPGQAMNSYSDTLGNTGHTYCVYKSGGNVESQGVIESCKYGGTPYKSAGVKCGPGDVCLGSSSQVSAGADGSYNYYGCWPGACLMNPNGSGSSQGTCSENAIDGSGTASGHKYCVYRAPGQGGNFVGACTYESCSNGAHNPPNCTQNTAAPPATNCVAGTTRDCAYNGIPNSGTQSCLNSSSGGTDWGACLVKSCNPNGAVDPNTWTSIGWKCDGNSSQSGQAFTCGQTTKFAFETPDSSCPGATTTNTGGTGGTTNPPPISSNSETGDPGHFDFTSSSAASCNGTSPVVNLSWTAADTAVHYGVDRKDPDGTWVNPEMDAGGNISFTDSSVSPNQTYTYVVYARNAVGTTASSSQKILTTSSCTAPVTGLPAITVTTPACWNSPQTDGSDVQVTWSASNPAVSQLRYGVDANYSLLGQYGKFGITGTSSNLAGVGNLLNANNTYYIAASDGTSLGPISTFNVPLCSNSGGGTGGSSNSPVPQVTNPSCFPSDGSNITISWNTTDPSVSWVDISTNPDFPDGQFYHKQISAGSLSTDGTGFTGTGSNGNLTSYAVGRDYYVRTWNGVSHSDNNFIRVDDTCSGGQPGPSASPGSGATVSYKISEDPVTVDQQAAQPYVSGGDGSMYVPHTFVSNNPGLKTVYVEFIDSTGKTDVRSASIQMVAPDPVISNISCSLDVTGSGVAFDLNGQGFGTQTGTLQTAKGDNVTVSSWTDSAINADLAATGISSNDTFVLTLNRSDGQTVQSPPCKIGASQLVVNTAPACTSIGALNTPRFSNVAFQALDLTTGALDNETVSVDSTGAITGLQTKLTPNNQYKISVKAPLSLRRTSQITALPGTTALDFLLPLGDIYPLANGDGAINTFDYTTLKGQWNISETTISNVPGDLNADGAVNSVDWACMRNFFNQTDDSSLVASSSGALQ